MPRKSGIERRKQQQQLREQRKTTNIGSEAVDIIEQTASYVAQRPVVRQVLGFVSGTVKLVDETVLEPARQAAMDPSQVGTPQALTGAAVIAGETLMEMGARGGGIIAEKAGIDPRIGQFVGGTATESLLTAGVGAVGRKAVKAVDMMTPPGTGMAPQLATPSVSAPQITMRGGSVSLQPPTVMKAVTARDPESLRLAGVKTGEDIISPEQAKQLTKRSLKVEKHLAKIDSLETGLIDALDTGADAYTIKRLRANLKKERPKLYSTRSNISVPTPEDPLYYGTAAAKRDRQAVALTEGITETLEEHHLFPKVVSGAFFGKMDELIKAGKAELDDLVLMNRVAIAKGRKPGDYKSGMYILGETPHNEYHTLMKEAGDEFKRNQAEAWAGVVNEAKTVDDLLVLWRDTLDNLVVPTAEDIQSYNKLDKLLQDIRSTF
jgi:hypothetical protein